MIINSLLNQRPVATLVSQLSVCMKDLPNVFAICCRSLVFPCMVANTECSIHVILLLKSYIYISSFCKKAMEETKLRNLSKPFKSALFQLLHMDKKVLIKIARASEVAAIQGGK